jgi:hypothetical protein
VENMRGRKGEDINKKVFGKVIQFIPLKQSNKSPNLSTILFK